MEFKFKTKLWIYPGPSAWHFLNIPKKESIIIKESFTILKRGFGSIKILAKVKDSEWKTSIFPDSKSGTYLLPIKQAIRIKESLKAGDYVEVEIRVTI